MPQSGRRRNTDRYGKWRCPMPGCNRPFPSAMERVMHVFAAHRPKDVVLLLADYRRASLGVLDAYQKFLDTDDLDALRDALTELMDVIGEDAPPSGR